MRYAYLPTFIMIFLNETQIITYSQILRFPFPPHPFIVSLQHVSRLAPPVVARETLNRNNMNFLLPLFAGLVLSCCTPDSHNAQQTLSLRYDQPGRIWEETLPLGNGRIGMMPDGGISREHIVLNDITMWSGSEDPDAIDRRSIGYLPQIRQLLLEGKNAEAQNLMYHHFKSGGKGSAFGNGKNTPYGCFQMLGDLFIDHRYLSQDTVQNYTRTLSLNEAVVQTRFTKGDIIYTREYFASHAHNILIIRLTANKNRAISFTASLSRPERATVSVIDNILQMEGQLNDGYDTDRGVRYHTKLRILNRGGTLYGAGKSLTLTGADEAILVISSSTDMLDKRYIQTVDSLLNKTLSTPFDKLKQAHTAAYQEKFNRVQLYLGEQDHETATDRRLVDFQTTGNPSLTALYFQYGRYLMICGTNESTLPLNLQGMWANTVQTPWNGDYHLNINLQMNYWIAEVGNLSELHTPLIAFTQSLVPSGTQTAKAYYNAQGWMAHMMSNPWKFTAPGEHASWGATNTGGAWLCQHLWERYAFTQDKNYLATIYPTLRGAADNLLSNMIEEPKNGWLVTAPSSSPENGFYMPGSQTPVFVCMGPTMDVQIIREVFENTLQAAKILEIEDEIIKRIETTIPKLPPMQVSPKGYLQEWLEDYEEAEPTHRHVSHLYGLYPSNQISPDATPELAKAARETLNRRGDGGTGWSRAWKINFWARLHDGNRAYKLLKSLMKPAFTTEGNTYNGKGGTYANLFCAHPPFQIDGNFGGAAGIAEMLIQSHNGYIELLPAIPDVWTNGYFKGLRVRGGAEVNVAWENKLPKTAEITASVDNTFKLKIPQHISSVKQNGKPTTIEDGFVACSYSLLHF